MNQITALAAEPPSGTPAELRGTPAEARARFAQAQPLDRRRLQCYLALMVADMAAVVNAQDRLAVRKLEHRGRFSFVPDEPTPEGGGSGAGRAFSQRH